MAWQLNLLSAPPLHLPSSRSPVWIPLPLPKVSIWTLTTLLSSSWTLTSPSMDHCSPHGQSGPMSNNFALKCIGCLVTSSQDDFCPALSTSYYLQNGHQGILLKLHYIIFGYFSSIRVAKNTSMESLLLNVKWNFYRRFVRIKKGSVTVLPFDLYYQFSIAVKILNIKVMSTGCKSPTSVL